MMVRIKICGITNQADAELAASLGVDWIGLNFYEKSPRYVTPTIAGAIVRQLPAPSEAVALFVNTPAAEASRFAHTLAIRTVQLHGMPSASLPTGVQWIPAFSIADAASLQAIDAYLDQCAARAELPRAILVDAHVPGLHGGTGRTAPWSLLSEYRPKVPMILAGGLTPENVAEAIRLVRPYGVDVASGVESSPGKKDADRLRRFVNAVRSVSE